MTSLGVKWVKSSQQNIMVLYFPSPQLCFSARKLKSTFFNNTGFQVNIAYMVNKLTASFCVTLAHTVHKQTRCVANVEPLIFSTVNLGSEETPEFKVSVEKLGKSPVSEQADISLHLIRSSFSF